MGECSTRYQWWLVDGDVVFSSFIDEPSNPLINCRSDCACTSYRLILQDSTSTADGANELIHVHQLSSLANLTRGMT